MRLAARPMAAEHTLSEARVAAGEKSSQPRTTRTPVPRRCSSIGELIESSSYEDAILATSEGLFGCATSRVDLVLPTRMPFSAEVQLSMRALLSGLDDTVRVRLLCAESAISSYRLWQADSQGPGIEVRKAGMALNVALIVDGEAALVGRRMELIRDPAAVQSRQRLFDLVWERATPMFTPFDLEDETSSELTRRVLRQLQAGVTDEVAAREMLMGLRTYRRHVARIMELLGARSRFQAGVHAAEAGLAGRVE